MQILFLNEIAFNIIWGVFNIVAKTYDIMLELVVKQDSLDLSNFKDMFAILYVLAGVFMLFRVAIGMIQMILNPDQVTDKQAGAGKLVTRVVTSIVLLLVFVPNGLLFGDNGLFARIEQAILLEEDGLIYRIMHLDGAGESLSIGNDKLNNDFLIENVYAKENPDLTCYYYRVENSKVTGTTPAGHGSSVVRTSYEVDINKIYKIYFYKSPTNTEGLTVMGPYASPPYYKFETGRIGGANGPKYDDGSSVYYSTLGYKISEGKIFDDKFPSECPGAIMWDSELKYWVPAKGYLSDYFASENGLHGGASTLAGLKTLLNEIRSKNSNVTINSSNPFVLQNAKTKNSHEYLNDIDKNAITFAQGTASSLQECVQDKKDECNKAQQKMFVSTEGNEAIIKLADNGDLELGFIVSMIAGLGLIIYLVLLCVEIIIRRLKLFFLEVMSPIPIISYVDPKDKIFNQWMKMYLSTYVDLFIKLISISIAINLLKTVFDNFWISEHWYIKFFYIVAILVFAKLLPSMVSKIFGLDSLGGSFKDIVGMGKAAAGFAAGAAIGGVAGVATGFSAASKAQGVGNKILAGIGGVGSGLSGLARGAGAGSKGNILGGAKNVAGINANRRSLYAGGVTPRDLIAAGTLGRLGLDKASRVDKSNLKDSERLNNLKKGDDFMKNMKEGAQSTKFFKSLRDYASDPNNDFRLTEKQWGDVEDAVASAHLMGADEKDRANQVLRDRLAAAGVSSDILRSAWGNDNDMIDGKQRDIMRSDAELYEEFISNSSDVRGLVSSGKYLTTDEINYVGSNASEDRFMRYKATDKSVKSESRELNKRIEKAKLDPSYAAANAVRNAGSNDNKK